MARGFLSAVPAVLMSSLMPRLKVHKGFWTIRALYVCQREAYQANFRPLDQAFTASMDFYQAYFLPVNLTFGWCWTSWLK